MAAGRPRATIEQAELHGLVKNEKSKYEDYTRLDMTDTLVNEPLTCPSTYSAKTKTAWNRVFPNITNLRILTEQDLNALITGFDAYEEMVKAQKAIKTFDKNFDPTDFIQVKHRRALSQWMLQSMEAANRVFARFGLMPTERSRLNLVGEEKVEDVDPLDVVLGD